MPPTISLEAAMPTVTKMREIILSHPEVNTVISQHGRPDNGSDTGGFSDAEIFVFLKPLEQWPPGLTKEKLIEQLQKEFSESSSASFSISRIYPEQYRRSAFGRQGRQLRQDHRSRPGSARADRGPSHHEMAQINGIEDLGIFRVLGQPNLNIKVNREKTARYGLNAGDVNTVIQTAMDGNATTVLEGDRQFDLTVRLAPEYRNNIEAVRNIKVGYQRPLERLLPLSELAEYLWIPVHLHLS